MAPERGELAPPQGAAQHDTNNDGAFTVLDYTTATGTEAPTLDRISAPDLLARDDGGDTNANGILDPQDILRIYGDGIDNDGDGYIDDICGWDFVDNDPDPFDGPDAVGPAHYAVARANDGVGVAGACPGCRGVPLRVGRRGASEASALALALLFAVDHGARVAMVAVEVWGDRPELHEAVDYAESNGTLVMMDRGRRPGRTIPVPWRSDRVLEVGSVGPDTDDLATATRFDARDPCSGIDATVQSPGRCDGQNVGIAAGVAGLIWTAAAGLPERDRAPWPVEPTPAEVRALMSRHGARRLDARAAIDATLDQRVPTPAFIEAPADRVVFDPSRGAPIRFRARLPAQRDRAVEWHLEAATGFGVPNYTSIESGRTTPDDPPWIDVDVPSVDGRPIRRPPPARRANSRSRSA